MKRSAQHRLTVLILAVATSGTAASLSGCGSGTTSRSTSPASSATGSASPSAEGRGRAAITIHWPTRSRATSRLIPEASNSIVVQMVRPSDGKVQQNQTIPRPTDPADGSAPISTITFNKLPVDTLTVVATAYPSADGSGVAQATGTGSLTTTADGSVASFGVTMGSTIDHIKLTPTASKLLVGTTRTVPLMATAYNGANESTASVVLLWPGKLTWSTGNSSVASVDSSGVVTAGTTLGTATIQVQDSESGKSASATLRVVTSLAADSVGPAQFNPNGTDYANTLTADSAGTTPYTGGWTTVSGHNYQFNTGQVTAGSSGPLPTLTDTTTNTVVAYGKLVTQTFGQAATSITYAVFDFPGDITIGNGSKVTAVPGSHNNFAKTSTNTNPLVVLTQGAFTISGGASLDVSGSGYGGGAGGWSSGQGPGVGQYTPSFPTYVSGGASFGGLGGGSTSGVYGTDFDSTTAPHFQGGSGGAGVVSEGVGAQGLDGAGGGGAVYIGSAGALMVSRASILASGATPLCGSGGGIALFGGGGVQLSSPTIQANGCPGSSYSKSATSYFATIFGGGGGGRIVIGYASGNAPSTAGVTASGGKSPYSPPSTIDAGHDGTVDVVTFGGF